MSGYIGNIPTPQATQSRQSFTATAGQTSFATVGYTAGFIDVYLNGVHLLDGTDYTATNGSDIVLTTGAALDDVVEFVAYETFSVLDPTFTGTTTVDALVASGVEVATVGADFTINDTAGNFSTNTADARLRLEAGNTTGAELGFVNTTSGQFTIRNKLNGDMRFRLETTTKKFRFEDTTGSNTIATISNSGMKIGGGNTSANEALDVIGNIRTSGGIYLGGTGAANKLDAYEFGTWTPTMAGLTLSVANGKYTKIGELVTCTFQINSTGITNPNAANLGGLPFTNSDMNLDGRSGGYIAYNQSGINFTLLFLSGNPSVTFRVTPTGENGSITQVSGKIFWGTIIYRTTA